MIKICVIIVFFCYINYGFGGKKFATSYINQRSYNFRNNYEENRWLCLVLGICSMYHPGQFIQNSATMMVIKQWTKMEYLYPSEKERTTDIYNGNYVQQNVIPIDVDVYYSTKTQDQSSANAYHHKNVADNKSNRIFVTTPRFQQGIPAALSVVTDRVTADGNPLLQPYPSWKWHRNVTKCSAERIVSVYRVFIDKCDLLWVLDTGRLIDDIVCPPQILAFDLKTNRLVHRYEFTSNLYEARSIFVTPMVEHLGGKCDRTFVYAADCRTYSIIVHDVSAGTAWQITDKTMYPYPDYGTFSIAGDSFDLMDGILGMSLSPTEPRRLFFHAMSSGTENWVYTSDLRNRTRFLHDPESSPEIFHTYHGRRSTQSAAEAVDSNGIAYFGLMSDLSIDCWNTHVDYDPKNMDVIARNPMTLQFASGVKVVTNRHGREELWVMTSRFQKAAAGTLDLSDVNFRVHAGFVEELVFSTKCRAKYHANVVGNGGGSGGGYGLLTTNKIQTP